MKKIPCVMMRGGTSRGAFLLAEHLPEDQTQRDKILMAIMGSGNDLEIDGIGGGNPLTSKVAIISRSSDPRADVDYLFAQVIVHEQRVDTTPNCGNMLSGVGAFAIENGLIAATSPVTRVRIRNVNTGTFIEADVQTPNGVVEYEGSARIDGVPGTAAPVALTFLNAAGTKITFAPSFTIIRDNSGKRMSKQSMTPILPNSVSNTVSLSPAVNVSDSLNV